MKILQVISHYAPAYRFGGPLRVAHGLSRAFVKKGHSVTVCCTNLADDRRDLECPTGTPIEFDGVTVFYEPTFLSRYWGFSPSLGSRIKRETASADVVFVHAHYQYASLAGARNARKQHKPYVIFPHNSLRRRGIAFKNGIAKRLYLLLLERANLRGAAFLAFNSPEEKEGSLYSSRGRVVPNGICPKDFADRPPLGWFRERFPELRQKVLILYLGRLDFRQKGLDILIPAFTKVRKDHRELHLVLAGPDQNGGLRAALECSKECGVAEAVTVTGLLDGITRVGALQDADVFVLPSHFEGMSIALLEALYFGVPLLISDKAGLCHEVRERQAGLVVSPTVHDLASGLKRLTDPSLREGLRGNGTDLISRYYTWDAIAESLVSLISKEDVLGDLKPGSPVPDLGDQT